MARFVYAEVVVYPIPSNERPLIIVQSDGVYGYADWNGHLMIEPQFTEAFDFRADQVARVAIDSDEGKRYGLIDSTGEWVVEPIWTVMGESQSGIFFREKMVTIICVTRPVLLVIMIYVTGSCTLRHDTI